MAENSKISWTHHTFNPWVGCEKVSPACDRCYAERWAIRGGHHELWQGRRRRTTENYWRGPLQWNARARKEGRRERVFCASLADVWDNQVPREWREDLFELIRATPWLDWLLLSKRIGNAVTMLPADASRWQNVWLGATVANAKEFARDVPKLKALPAPIRFLSMEPLLGPMGKIDLDGIHWVIVGGENAPHPRALNVNWAIEIRDQCLTQSVPFLFKQGSSDWPDFRNIETFPPALQLQQVPEVMLQEPESIKQLNLTW